MTDESKYKVCIVGLGPSGLGAALTLSNSELSSQVICLEQGGPSNSRTCSVLGNGNCEGEKPCQMISGFGGSSLLGGGKMSAFPAGTGLATILGCDDAASKRVTEAITVLGTYIPLHEPDISLTDITHAEESFRKLGFGYKYDYLCGLGISMI